MTFEYISPREALNSKAVKPISRNELFKDEVINDTKRMPRDTVGLRYSNQ